MAELTRDRLNALHEELKRKAIADIEAIRSELDRKLKALDEVWQMLQKVSDGASPAEAVSAASTIENQTALESESEDRTAFPTGRRVEEIIQEMSVNSDITQPVLFNMLRERYPEVRERNARSVKGQLAAILKKLTNRGALRVRRESHGVNPTVYRKVAQAQSVT